MINLFHQKTLQEINKNILTALKESDDEAYQSSLKELLEQFEPKLIKKIQNEDRDFVYEGTYYELLDESDQDWMKSFQSRWSEKIERVRSSYLEFKSVGSIFDENYSLKNEDDVLDPIYILEHFQSLVHKRSAINENMDLVIEWKERVNEIVNESVLSGIDPFSKDWKIKLLKNLVQYKNNTDSGIAIHETVKEIESVHTELFENSMPIASDSATPSGGGYDGENKLHFLKMSGTFTNDDLKNLIRDFDYALGSWNNKTKDELGAISALKDKIEYMYRTNNIDDEEAASCINTFNMKYGRDGRDMYRDPAMKSGGLVYRNQAPEMTSPEGM